MKKIFVMFALMTGVVASAFAQNATDSTSAVTHDATLTADIYHGQEDGDLYHGLTRKLTFDRMVPPYGLEVTYDKTTHIIFPSAVRYVDLGSPNLVAGKADGAENVIRVKAVVKNFRDETNMSVITESGSFYTFNVKYADEPLLLNIEMKDFIHDGSKVNRPNNALDIYLKELGSESPKLVQLINKSIHKENKRHVKHIGSKAFGIQYLLRGIYTHNGMFSRFAGFYKACNAGVNILITLCVTRKKNLVSFCYQNNNAWLNARKHNVLAFWADPRSKKRMFIKRRSAVMTEFF